MGNFEKIFELGGSMTFGLPADVRVFANPADIAALRETAFARELDETALIPLGPDADLPTDVIRKARVVVLEVDPTSKASLRRVAKVRDLRPDLPIIAAIHEANVSLTRELVRQGVSDVAVLPFAPDELASQVLEACASLTGSGPSQILAPMFTVVHSSGGGGATTIITHLAAVMAANQDLAKGVCVLDLDLQNGDVSAYMAQSPRTTLSSLLEAGERIDGEYLRGVLTDSGHGFSIVAAPREITPLDSIDMDQLLAAIELVRKESGLVLVDLPSNWTNWTLSVATQSTKVILVTDLSIASLRQAKRRVELLCSVGISRDNILVVVNRVERRLFRTIGVDEVKQALGCEVVATLRAEGTAVSAAQDEGALISDVSHRSKFGSDIASLARTLLAVSR